MVEHVLVYNIPYLWICMVLQISYRWTYNFLFMVNCCFYVFDFAIVLTAKCQLAHYYLIAFFFFFEKNYYLIAKSLKASSITILIFSAKKHYSSNARRVMLHWNFTAKACCFIDFYCQTHKTALTTGTNFFSSISPLIKHFFFFFEIYKIYLWTFIARFFFFEENFARRPILLLFSLYFIT